MRRAYRILPVYSGDVSGAAAALFELGGMTVMHDPSGCNSTYNTHDEIRWYDQDSLIFITGLTDQDAILGDDERLIHDIEKACGEFHPNFVALVNSPIPYLNATDFDAISSIIEENTGVPVFYVPTNGCHDYVYGAGGAFRKLAECVVDRTQKPDGSGRVNLLGCTPLDFPADGEVDSLKDRIRDGGFSIGSCWAMGDGLESLKAAGRGDVNLVVSAVGLSTAKWLYERFGTPYVAGLPLPGFENDIYSALRRAMETGEHQIPYLDRASGGTEEFVFIGDPVCMGTMAAMKSRQGICARVICPVEAGSELIGEQDAMTRGEEDVEREIAHASEIVADPLYRHICPPDVHFTPEIHFAFSGRMFRRQLVDRFQKKNEENEDGTQ